MFTNDGRLQDEVVEPEVGYFSSESCFFHWRFFLGPEVAGASPKTSFPGIHRANHVGGAVDHSDWC
jgi:hypothetical protein